MLYLKKKNIIIFKFIVDIFFIFEWTVLSCFSSEDLLEAILQIEYEFLSELHSLHIVLVL